MKRLIQFELRLLTIFILLLSGIVLKSQTISTSTILGTPFCKGSSVKVPYTITGTFNSDNIFTAELSDAAGNFTAPIAIGTLATNIAGKIVATLPSNIASGSGYRIRVNSSSPAVIGIKNTINQKILDDAPASIAISTPSVSVCSPSNPVAFTNIIGCTASGNNLTRSSATAGWTEGASSSQTISNGGFVETTFLETNTKRIIGLSSSDINVSNTSIQYGILANSTAALSISESGVIKGTFGTYTTGDVYRISVIDGLVKYSRNGKIFYTSATPPTLPLIVDVSMYSPAATLKSVIYAPTINPVIFTANTTNGGTTPSYKWQVNGSAVGTNSATFNDSSFKTNDVINCILTSNATCVVGSPATSNNLTMTVSNNLPVSVTISPNTSTTIGLGTTVTFTATPTNGGSTPMYQWKKNGSTVGTNSSTYTTNTLLNGDVITCILTSNATCTTGNPATSNSVTITVVGAPIITSYSANINQNNDPGQCSAIVNYSAATATGAPTPTLTYSKNSGTSFNLGTTTVTVTASNIYGNTTATFNVTISSPTKNWLGTISSNWFDANNWCGGVPTATNSATIPSGVPHMPIINAAGALCKDLTINSGATLTMSSLSDLSLSGNWINNGTFISGTGNVIFNGITTQTISGTNTFNDLTINNNAGITINNNIIIGGVLDLQNGTITTNSNVVTINTTGSSTSDNGFVNGYLKKYVPLGVDTLYGVYFEVGSGNNYAPVLINFDSISSPGYITVNSVASDHPSIASSGFDINRTVNRYWNLVNSGVVFTTYSIGLQYAASDPDPAFVATNAGLQVYNGSIWNTIDQTANDQNYEMATDISLLGSFQIGQTNTAPELFSITPAEGIPGQTLSIVFKGANFINGISTLNNVSDITFNSISVTSDSTIIANITIATTGSGSKSFAVTNTLASGAITSAPLTFSIVTKPHASFYANTTTIKCYVSDSVQFYNTSTNGTSYSWNFGLNAHPATAIGFGPFSVSYSTTGYKTVTLTATNASGSETTSIANYIKVNSTAPAAPTSISGPNKVCSYGTNNVVYSGPYVNGTVNYIWTVPAGVTIVSGQGNRSVFVSFSPSFTSGNISLQISNICGTSAASTLAVTKTPMPTVINGPSMVCGTTVTTYSTTTVPEAGSYQWTVPTGMTIISGQGTLSIIVIISSNFSTGVVSVAARNSCGLSPTKNLTIYTKPPTPAPITGLKSVCGITSTTYSTPVVATVNTYNWVVPAGVTIVSGDSTNTITVNIDPAFSAGNITVTETNDCGTSVVRGLTIGCSSRSVTAPPVDSINNDEISQDLIYRIYPNPNDGTKINVDISGKQDQEVIVELYDILGKKNYSKTITINENGTSVFDIVPTQKLTSGIYIIKASTNEKIYSKRLIVE